MMMTMESDIAVSSEDAERIGGIEAELRALGVRIEKSVSLQGGDVAQFMPEDLEWWQYCCCCCTI